MTMITNHTPLVHPNKLTMAIKAPRARSLGRSNSLPSVLKKDSSTGRPLFWFRPSHSKREVLPSVDHPQPERQTPALSHKFDPSSIPSSPSVDSNWSDYVSDDEQDHELEGLSVLDREERV